MKRFISLFLGIFLLIVFGCRNETEKKLPVAQKKQAKNIEIIKRSVQLKSIEPIKKVVKLNPNFSKFYESLKPDTYSIDELVDLTQKDLKIFKELRIRRFNSKIDTPAVKSRLVLTEVNLKRLNFLLHKKKIETDTIRKTLDELTRNLNATIDKISLYNQSIDEFENILVKDSLMQAHKDSLQNRKEVLQKLQKQKFKKSLISPRKIR